MTVETRRFDDEGVKANIAFAKEHNIDCGYRQGENVQVYDTPEVYAIGQKHFQAAQKAGLTGARWLSKEEMKRVLGTTEYAAADAVPGAHMFPAKFVWYLLDQAIASGLELHTHTPVIDVNNGVVTTKDGSVVTAKHVVFATNAWTSHLVPELRGHIIPLRDQVITVPRTDSATDPVLPSGGLWMSNGSEYAIELSNGGRLIMGGFYEESGRHQAGNANDAELIPGVSTDLREALVSVPPLQKFPYDKPASPEIHEWTGIIAVSNDSAPYVGKLERLSSDKYSAWIVAGHNGEGMPRCFLFGKYIAQKLAQSFGMHVADPIAIPRAMKPNPHRVSNLDYFAWNLE
ncbi:hypothetical protein EC988_006164 [Linderina pennispora]|nr:hypothetical protein EC988_006164 [Linderina pennispora]